LAGLGRKEFNSGDILLASEVQGYLQDQAVMVFDDATARGSAIPSPTEGMLTYNKDTDQLELYDGAAFGPVGSDAGLIHIKTESFSGAVSHSFGSDADPIFTSDYANYKIVFDNVLVASSTSVVSLRVRANTTDLTGSNYNHQTAEFSGSTSTIFRALNGTSQRIMACASTANEGSSSVIDILTPQETKPTLFQSSQMLLLSGTGPVNLDTRGFVLDTVSYNGFTIFAGFNLSGRVSIYGYRK
jgi:hypothetical protein